MRRMRFYISDFVKSFNFFLLPLNKIKFFYFYKFQLGRNKKENKKHILFVNHEESITGAPKILFEVLKNLKYEYNYTILSLCKGGFHREFRENFKKNMLYPGDIFLLHNTFYSIKKIIKTIKPDLVYVNTIVPNRYLTVAKSLKIPTICHVHEGESALEFCFRSDKEIRSFISSTDKFISVSQKTDWLLKSVLNIFPDKIINIPGFILSENIIELSRAKTFENIKTQLDLKQDEIFICTIASITGKIGLKRKGFDVLLESIKLLEKNFSNLPKIKFVWIGKYKKGLVRKFLKKNNFPHDKLLLLGEIKNPYPYLAAADLFIMPSREDPLPLAFLEAIALGKPVIVFRSSGDCYKVVKKETGTVIEDFGPEPLARTIFDMVQNLNSYKENILKSKISLNEYDQRKIIPLIQNVIDSI